MNVVIYGPQACGKTRNADKFANFFGCTVIIDIDDQGRETKTPPDFIQKFTAKSELQAELVDTLFLTNSDRLLEDMRLIGDARYISFDDAIKLVNQPVTILKFLRRAGSFGGSE